jgi:hypothetical protein
VCELDLADVVSCIGDYNPCESDQDCDAGRCIGGNGTTQGDCQPGTDGSLPRRRRPRRRQLRRHRHRRRLPLPHRRKRLPRNVKARCGAGLNCILPATSFVGTCSDGESQWRSKRHPGAPERDPSPLTTPRARRRRMTEALRDKLPAARVVLNQSGRTPSRQAVWTELHALLVRHKLPERSFHALRHYFLTALVRGGANLEAVRELAGHSKLHTTQRYVHAIARLSGN